MEHDEDPRSPIEIDPDIRSARNLPPAVYRDERFLELARERAFARSWQLVADDADRLSEKGHVRPVTLLEGFLDEPLLLASDEKGELRCLSNVCTHRGNVLACEEGKAAQIRCRYHGRRFALDGRFVAMPELEGALGFPSPEDDLESLPLARLSGFLFASLDPAFPFEDLVRPLRERLAWLDLARLVPDPASARDFTVGASWALYVDNYLEGFHIPYVHGGLASVLDYAAYRTELHEWSSLQLGIAAEGEEAFEPPPGSPDHGLRVAAYYWWLFPNIMLNFYPWGLSLNVVTPLERARTRVAFRSYVLDASKRARGAGAALERVELEDEAIVESVARGVRSRLCRRGRYSPKRETGVHHFHRLLARALGTG